MVKAIGCHVFAAGFMAGVKQVMPVEVNLERHGFGLQTSEKRWGIPTINAHPSEWPRVSADVIWGNPRCTGFSVVTSGYGASAHGPEAKQCQDIHDLMNYSLGHYPVIVWESVQQAYTTGKPLLDALAQRCIESGYRVAHLFINAATFGCPQNRKRYFFVAYPKDKQFNVSAPAITPHYATIYDAIWSQRERETREMNLYRDTSYDRDCYVKLTDAERDAVQHIYTGACLNTAAPYVYDMLPKKLQDTWRLRASPMPFSMHTIVRLAWMCQCPTLKNSSGRLLHPWHHRPLTVGELALCMGWHGGFVGGDPADPVIPAGPDPVGQIAKGVVPAVGQWIAEQVVECLEDRWGGEDWESRYDQYSGGFVGRDTKDEPVKVIDLTDYRGWFFDHDRFPEECKKQMHRFNVDPSTGKVIRDWRNVVRVD